jgi:hypothetical protein
VAAIPIDRGMDRTREEKTRKPRRKAKGEAEETGESPYTHILADPGNRTCMSRY